MRKYIFLVLAFLTFYNVHSQGWQWQNPLPQGNSLYAVRFIDSTKGYMAGNCGTILGTNNGGSTWSIIQSGTTNRLRSICFTDTNTGYISGEGGTILKTVDGGGFFVGNKNNIPVSSSLKIFPNPSSNEVTIETSTGKTISHLAIINLNGQELIVHQITDSKTKIDISNLPSGFYFVRVLDDLTVEMGKFIKL